MKKEIFILLAFSLLLAACSCNKPDVESLSQPQEIQMPNHQSKIQFKRI